MPSLAVDEDLEVSMLQASRWFQVHPETWGKISNLTHIFLNWVETTNCRFIACNDYISIFILGHMLNAQLNCNKKSNRI